VSVPAELASPSDDRLVSVPAGQEIGKLTLGQISWPMPGSQSIAVAARWARERQLRPSSVNWPSGSFRSTAVVRMTAPKGWRPAAIG